ncbi:hydroxymethylglutaryl-CoA reductase, degradative [Sporosarcina oncorhynchi]|uniref:3-hydroxy-3-methylglutaryl coenzyme A reductase n=1 Tax=Sporosarcina oncorhynchi TaxID=3056444 RepID=A0ABZ0L7Y6_9BACL|nr:hydroxymethylglutaryl-CoA reductase, degradative [Sporosarcina sp. T2O-4]WOV88235.1 hydroxymethylglutaryl-CoA reductase, degradative [Sporosarcina sp. T2O-4]
MKTSNSRLPKYFKLSVEERQAALASALSIEVDKLDLLMDNEKALPLSTADKMIENVVGTFQLPFGIATNFTVNGSDVLIPMAVEEPSVVAAASNMARIARDSGGFTTSYNGSIMIGQMHVINIDDMESAQLNIEGAKKELMEKANSFDKTLVALGGGVKDIQLRHLALGTGEKVLVIHLHVNVLDAMGANAVNTMAERLTPDIEKLTGGTVLLRILSNLADQRLTTAKVAIPFDHLDTGDFNGSEVAKRMVLANEIALADPYRAATHNKGIMNGIDPVLIATGNDWRAIEAGAHAFAAKDGQYRALTKWTIQDETLHGELTMPMAVGIIGGATKTHPTARLSLEIMNIQSAADLAQLVVAVGLAQNMGAIRALATEGIQRGHMTLHARNIASQIGRNPEEIDWLEAQMIEHNDVRMDAAKEFLNNRK